MQPIPFHARNADRRMQFGQFSGVVQHLADQMVQGMLQLLHLVAAIDQAADHVFIANTAIFIFILRQHPPHGSQKLAADDLFGLFGKNRVEIELERDKILRLLLKSAAVIRVERFNRSALHLAGYDLVHHLRLQFFRRDLQRTLNIFHMLQLFLNFAARLSARTNALQHRGQFRLFDRLEQIILRTILQSGVRILKLAIAADDHDIDILFFLAHAVQKLQTAALGHADIGHDDIGLMALYRLQRIPAIVHDLHDLKTQTFPVNDDLQQLTNLLFVICQYDLKHRISPRF